MTFLLRKISMVKWQPNLDLEIQDYSGDAITGCIKTSKNTLSVWGSGSKDFNSDEVEKLIVALATSMSAPDTIDLIWMDEDKLKEEGIEVLASPGGSKFIGVNDKHFDLMGIKLNSLGLVGKHITDQYNVNSSENYKRIIKSDLVKLVTKWINKDSSILTDQLSVKWREYLAKQNN